MLNSNNKRKVYQGNQMVSESEQPESKELLKQVLECLKTLITFKENQPQKSEQYKQEIENIVNLIFEFFVKILTEKGLWNESEENVKETARRILEFSLLTHLQFDSDWAKPSYHNEIHILAVICAFLEILPTLRHDDIFAIENTLNTWNQNSETSGSSTSPITLGEFALAMVMALATHDLGNILETVQEEGENPKAIFHKVYHAEGAEERSKAIASVLITKFYQAVDEAKIQQIIGLVQHLIEQTIFQPTPSIESKQTPWWLLIQIIDQIGGNVVLLSTNPNYYVSTVAGLIIEILKVRTTDGINLTNFLNFVAFRLNVFITQVIITQEFAEKVLALLSGNGFSSLNEPSLNQANKKNLAYIVKILEEVFPGCQVRVYTNETNQVSLRISQ
jgi:hypothetical protein